MRNSLPLLCSLSPLAKAAWQRCVIPKRKGNKPGQWEGLYHADSNLVLIEYYDFDPNIKMKTVLSNAFVNLVLVPVFNEYKAAFAFCDKFNRGFYERCWSHKQGGYLRLGDLGHQHNFAMSCALQNEFNFFCQINLLLRTVWTMLPTVYNLQIKSMSL